MKKQIVLKKNEEKRLISGHQWIFSNEIEKIHGTPEVGDVVELLRNDGAFLGIGFYNPHSLIAFRLLTRMQEEIDADFFLHRIEQANQLRERIYPQATTYRMVHSESDFLPGLIIDRYNEYCVLQISSAGMERATPLICSALETLFHPKAIVARNDANTRSLENLPQENKILLGTPGETIYNEENIHFAIDILKGQKTGFFLDQRENRKALRRYVAKKSVLDCFCNDGGFGLHAAAAGASEALGIDISEATIERAKVNVRLNSLNVNFIVADVFDYLKELLRSQKKFNVIVLDPPSFTKNKRTVATALHGYKQLHTLALQLLTDDGILATACCSHHISEEAFLSTAQIASLKVGRSVRLLELHGAAPDHPVLPAMPETRYLKFAIFAVQ
jgi:23S rRNA (cytosine1962-C5)-methyltransferase